MKKKGTLKGIDGHEITFDIEPCARAKKRRKLNTKKLNIDTIMAPYAKRCPICKCVMQKRTMLDGAEYLACPNVRRH